MLFLIPARAGSKRLPGKNKKLFCGIPLWQWSLATALRIGQPTDVALVSSDDDEIYNMPHGIMRPPSLSGDQTPTAKVVEFYFRMLFTHDSICLLQPTSPTRSDSLVRKLITHGGQVRSVTNGKPNGQCYVYRRGHTGWIDVETEQGHDIDTLEDFIEAEKAMLEKFK